ncbi:MAG: RNA polymerase sigma factor [Bacteroidota bacterium]|jgi:RNA polymerase sigma factor (sigma-70 family)
MSIQFDLEFIAQLKAGNVAVQKKLFETCYPVFIRICQRYLVRIDEAEDCVMRSFLKIYNHINAFRYSDNNSLYYWMKKIVVNEALMQIRKKQLFGPMPAVEMEEPAFETDIIERIDTKHLLYLITQLPNGYRTVFNLFVIEGYTHKEIAKLLNITENTSKSQLSKAKQHLKYLLSHEKYGYKTN